jgi:hypothetical protein
LDKNYGGEAGNRSGTVQTFSKCVPTTYNGVITTFSGRS